MKNLLIVESENDKFFIDALIAHMNLKNIEISDGIICNIDDVECMNGLSTKNLDRALEVSKNKAKKSDFQRIGLIIDIDNKTEAERLKLVNSSIENVFGISEALKFTGKLEAIELDDVQKVEIGTYFTNVNGSGELETVLKEIKTENSTHADCLNAWQECLKQNNIREGNGLKKKDFDKFWVSIYLRYDTCSRNERKQAGRKCNNEAAMLKPIWNFDHDCLIEFKAFLDKFNSI